MTDRTASLSGSGLRGMRRGPLLVGLAVGLLALVVAIWSLSGSQTEAVQAAAPLAQDIEEPDDVLEDPSEEVDELPTVTYDVYLARDPFDPVVPEPEPDPEPSDLDPSETDPSETDPPVVDPTDPSTFDPTDPSTFDPTDPTGPDPGQPGDGTPPSGDPSDPSAPGNGQPGRPDNGDPSGTDRCVGEEEVVCDGQVLTLLDIVQENGQQVAVIQVDDIIYEVRPGETFTGQFRLLEIDGDSALIQYGDDVFRTHNGATVLK